MDMTLAEVHHITGGDLRGDPARRVRGVRSLENAGDDDLSFVKDARHLARALGTRAGALLVPAPIPGAHAAQIIHPEPQVGLMRLLVVIETARSDAPAGIHASAVVDPLASLARGVGVGPLAVVREHATIGEGTTLGAQSYVGKNVRIGRDCRIGPHATILEESVLGDRVIVGPGSVIGKRGFGFIQVHGQHTPVPQIGTVVIEDDVELGALVTIDRATLEATRIGRGTKVDSHSHIAHNVTIGEDTLVIVCQIAGSARVGKNVILGAGTGVSDHRVVGDGARTGAHTNALLEDIPPGETWWGTPARPAFHERRVQVVLDILPEMRRVLKEIAAKVGIPFRARRRAARVAAAAPGERAE